MDIVYYKKLINTASHVIIQLSVNCISKEGQNIFSNHHYFALF